MVCLSCLLFARSFVVGCIKLDWVVGRVGLWVQSFHYAMGWVEDIGPMDSGAARGKGEASALWGDVQKLFNMYVLSLAWNVAVSHDKYIARPSSKEPR